MNLFCHFKIRHPVLQSHFSVKLIGLGAQLIRAAWLLLVFVTGTMKNYNSIEL
jgi:hypothetical protein